MEAILNHERLEEIMSTKVGGKKDIIQKIILLFVVSSKSKISEIKSAYRRDDFNGVKQVAAALRESCLNLGVQNLVPTAERIEAYSDFQDPELLLAKEIVLLESQFEDSLKELMRLRLV